MTNDVCENSLLLFSRIFVGYISCILVLLRIQLEMHSFSTIANPIKYKMTTDMNSSSTFNIDLFFTFQVLNLNQIDKDVWRKYKNIYAYNILLLKIGKLQKSPRYTKKCVSRQMRRYVRHTKSHICPHRVFVRYSRVYRVVRHPQQKKQ